MPRPIALFKDEQKLGKKDDDHRPGESDDLVLSDVFHVQWSEWKAGGNGRPDSLRRIVVTVLVLLSAVGIILYIAIGHENSIDARTRRRGRIKLPDPIHHKLEDYDLRGGHAALRFGNDNGKHAIPEPEPKIPKPETTKPDTEKGGITKPVIPKPAPETIPEPDDIPQPESKLSRLLGGGRPPEPPERDGRELQYYDGPLEWPTLAQSLSATNTGRLRSGGQHILFAAASLHSLARMAPMACEMARWNRNTVHIAIMGRYGLKMKKIKQLNGIDANCGANWHDARPNFPAYSTDKRLNLGTFQAFEHIRSYILPQAILTDERSREEPEFLKALDKYRAKYETTVVSLPVDAIHSMQWINRLDSGALAAWNKANVEILVRAPTGNSGSLTRLLQSLHDADYFGSRPPHLTIELPAEVDRHTTAFLDTFEWPPRTEDGKPQVSLLTLRKRLPKSSNTPADASMRLIESFYPSRTVESHVLLLGPEVELSRQYYHYLMYNLLEYKYSTFHQWSREMQDLFGISLVTPSYLLNGKTKLNRPTVPVEDKKGKVTNEELTEASPFLWQAPDTFATLYFGDKWKQLHSFFHHRIDRPDPAGGKEVSPSLPAFAEYFLELMLARGWYVLYPHLPGYEFATAHNELYKVPEEHLPKDESDGPLGPAAPKAPGNRKEEHLSSTPLHILLPNSGDLTELERMPMLSPEGTRLTAASKDSLSIAYTSVFREEVGDCAEGQEPMMRMDDYSADDLFCDASNRPAPGSNPIQPLKPVEEQIPVINDKGESNAPVPEDKLKAMKAELSQHLDRQKDRSG